MTVARKTSVQAPPAELRRLLFEASRRAEAMGLIPSDAVTDAEPATVRLLASRVRRAGLAAAAADQLHNAEAPSDADAAGPLKTLIAALEACPGPQCGGGGRR